LPIEGVDAVTGIEYPRDGGFTGEEIAMFVPRKDIGGKG
jgi:hypothetical protein